MISPARNDFLTARAWHQAVVSSDDVILRRASALEYLQLFHGYTHEKKIDVYAKRQGKYENINYCIVDSFEDIDYVQLDTVLCASASQTFNEMLADYDNADELALVEGLAGYYFSHGESFNGLEIRPENIERFNALKVWAVEYYDEN
jgi:hypothetical protein